MANSSSPSSPSSPNPAPAPASPRTRSTSGSPQRPRHQSVLLPRPPPPVMGAPGQSAFSPFTGPLHPAPSPSSNVGFGFPGPFPFLGAPGAVPVPVAGAGLYRIGSGMDNPAVRKRVREGGRGQDGKKQVEVGGNQFACSVCGKQFNTSRALFGHMRSHPDRGWKGAHPPEELAVPMEEVAAVDPPAAEGGEGGDGDAGQGEEEAGEAKSYRVPDLNHTAPQE